MPTTSEERALDALELEALDAWEVAEPDDGFADRVHLAASEHSANDAAPAAAPRAEEGPKPAAASPRPKRWGFAVAAASVSALLAGGASAWVALDPDRFDFGHTEEASYAPSAVEEEQRAEPDPLTVSAHPTLPPVTLGPPLPSDLGSRIEKHIDLYGSVYGDAFRFRGVVLVARGIDVVTTTHGHPGNDATKFTEYDTRYRIGSLTQQLTAVAVMQLVESELLSLDDLAGKYLPELAEFTRESGYQIRVRDLLSHGSGLANFTDSPQWVMSLHRPHKPEELVNYFVNQRARFVPGAEFEASNSNAVLLGRIIEEVSGRSYADYLQQHIFEPAQMRDTTLDAVANPTVRDARGFEFSEMEILEPGPNVHPSALWAAGGASSTAGDLLKFDRALRRGDLLSEASRALMYEKHHANYALGWVVSEIRGHTAAFHPGGTPGFNGQIVRMLDDGTTIIVLSNTEAVDARNIAADVSDLVYAEKPPIHVEHDEVFVAPSKFKEFEGHFVLSDKSKERLAKVLDPERIWKLGELNIVSDGKRLWMDIPDHGRKWMHPRGAGEFFFKDAAGTLATFGYQDERRWMRIRQGSLEFMLWETPAK